MQLSEKIYIGKGNQVKDFDMYNMTINLSHCLKEVTKDRNGIETLNLTITRMKEPDQFGRTHTAYVNMNMGNNSPSANKPLVPSSTRNQNGF